MLLPCFFQGVKEETAQSFRLRGPGLEQFGTGQPGGPRKGAAARCGGGTHQRGWEPLPPVHSPQLPISTPRGMQLEWGADAARCRCMSPRSLCSAQRHLAMLPHALRFVLSVLPLQRNLTPQHRERCHIIFLESSLQHVQSLASTTATQVLSLAFSLGAG